MALNFGVNYKGFKILTRQTRDNVGRERVLLSRPKASVGREKEFGRINTSAHVPSDNPELQVGISKVNSYVLLKFGYFFFYKTAQTHRKTIWENQLFERTKNILNNNLQIL